MSGKVSMGPEFLEEMTNNPEMHYNVVPYPNAENERLGVPSMRFCDGPRGVVCGNDKSTCYPVSMLRGATFNTDLEEEIGKAIGREVRAYGGNLFAGVCINLPYNPGWGRSQETYGEDAFALGQFGAALVRGVQNEYVMACLKHFAFNSMENSRFKVSIECDRRTEREVYFPHFKDCIDAGAASVMGSYNLYKGVHAGHSDYLLRKVLKEEWDFDGFVMSDFIWGLRDTVDGANNGMDLEMCATIHYGDNLVQAVKDDLVDESRIDDAAVRLVRTIIAFEEAYEKSGKSYGEEVIGSDEHIALALQAAQEGITLLQNKNDVLPLNKEKTKKVALIGKLADKPNLGDYGSSRVYPKYTISPYDGLKKALPYADVILDDGSDIERAKKLAQQADTVIFVVGFDHDDEGEFVAVDDAENYLGAAGGDRKETLGLHQEEIDLIKAVGPENENSTAVLIGGNMIMMTDWKDSVSSILMAYYPGQEGGTALAQILLGDVNPSGKLPYVLVEKESDLPQVKWETEYEFYDYYHGYAKLDKEGVKPLRPYGFGMSYTEFDVKDAAFSAEKDTVTASCTVTNTGERKGAEVIQLYAGFGNSDLDRPVKSLRGFERVNLQPGESKTVTTECPVEKFEYYNKTTGDFELENMEYEMYIGTSSGEEDLLKGSVTL